MRVGLVIYGSLQFLSGGFLYDRMLVNHLTACGDEVFVFRRPWPSYPRQLLTNFDDSLTALVKDFKPEILLQDELCHPSLVLPNRQLGKAALCPLVAIVHHLRCRETRAPAVNALYRKIESAYLRSVDGFVFNSRSSRAEVESLIGQVKSHTVATPGGDRMGVFSDERDIVNRCLASGPLRLLFVGNVVPRKDLGGLLKALARVRGVDWRLDVVGALNVDPAYVARISKSIQTAGLADKVTFHGTVDDAKLVDYLRAAHLMALPFSYEGFGIVFLEGFAFGLPALAGSQGGAQEVVRPGETGYLFRPGDVMQLSAVIRRLADQRQELLRLSLAARRRFDFFPNWKATATAVRRFLASLV